MPDAHFIADSPESVGIDSAKLAALFERAEKEVREGLLPSAQIAVARGGKIAGMRTFGRVTARYSRADYPAGKRPLHSAPQGTARISPDWGGGLR